MAGSDLAPIVKIRELRERSAASVMREAGQRVEQIEQLLERARAELVRFRQQCQAREQALFAAMQGNPVTLRELQDFQETLMEFKERDLQLQHKIAQIEHALVEARQAFATAHNAWVEASKAREKLSEFAALQVAERRRAREAQEEDELEELVANNFAFAARRA